MSNNDSGYPGSWSDALAQPASGSDHIFFSYPAAIKSPNSQDPGLLVHNPYADYRDPTIFSVSGIDDSLPDQNIYSPSDDPQEHEIDPNLPPPDASLAGVFAGNDVYNMNTHYLGPTDHSMMQNISLDPDLSSGFANLVPAGGDNEDPWNQQYQRNRFSDDTMTSSDNLHHFKRRRVGQDHDSAVAALTTPALSEHDYPPVPSSYPSASNTLPQAPLGHRREQRGSIASSLSGHAAMNRSSSAGFLAGPVPTTRRHTTTSQPAAQTPRKQHHCTRCPPASAKSFTTPNDLTRHMRGVHGVFDPGDKGWRCRVPHCTVANKLWPRRDNFVSHLKRMHYQDSHETAMREVDSCEEKYDPAIHGQMTVAQSEPETPNKKKRQREKSSPISSHGIDDAASTAPVIPGRFLPPNHGYSAPLYRFSQAGNHRTRLEGPSLMNHFGRSLPNGSQTPRPVSRPTGSQLSPTQWPPRPESGAVAPIRYSLTEPNPGSHSRQLVEMHEDNRAFQQTDHISPSMQDHAYLGEAMTHIDPAVLSNTRLSGSTHAVTLEPASFDQGDKYDKIFRQLSPEEKARLLDSFTINPDREQPERSVPKSCTEEPADEQKKHSCDVLIERKKGGGFVPCQSAFDSLSELKKHRRRHQKRFGCTFDLCYSKFGTKWEWKRHELKQHIQPEAWRCRYPDEDERCQKHFLDKSQFQDHLFSHYGHADRKSVERELKECHLPKKWLGAYWCGHCARVVNSPPHCRFGQEMMKERLEHVGSHILAGKDPLAWIELAADGKTKGEMKRMHEGGGSSTTSSHLAVSQTSQMSLNNNEDCDSDSAASDGSETSTECHRPFQASETNKARVVKERRSSSSHGSRTGPTSTTPTVRIHDPEGQEIEECMLDRTDVGNTPHPQPQQHDDQCAISQTQQNACVICCQCGRKAHSGAEGRCDYNACQHSICSSCMPIQEQDEQYSFDPNDFSGDDTPELGYGYLDV